MTAAVTVTVAAALVIVAGLLLAVRHSYRAALVVVAVLCLFVDPLLLLPLAAAVLIAGDGP